MNKSKITLIKHKKVKAAHKLAKKLVALMKNSQNQLKRLPLNRKNLQHKLKMKKNPPQRHKNPKRIKNPNTMKKALAIK